MTIRWNFNEQMFLFSSNAFEVIVEMHICSLSKTIIVIVHVLSLTTRLSPRDRQARPVTIRARIFSSLLFLLHRQRDCRDPKCSIRFSNYFRVGKSPNSDEDDKRIYVDALTECQASALVRLRRRTSREKKFCSERGEKAQQSFFLADFFFFSLSRFSPAAAYRSFFHQTIDRNISKRLT
jgi:hypothetical protein